MIGATLRKLGLGKRLGSLYYAIRHADVRRAFDAEYYLLQNPDVMAAGADPFVHFMVHGWRERRNPCEWFSVQTYLSVNEDVRAAGTNPFVHYIKRRKAEGWTPSPADGWDENAPVDWNAYSEAELDLIRPDFDPEFYLEKYPEVADTGVDPAVHYLVVGWRRGYDPNPDFSTDFYRTHYTDIRLGRLNPFAHYIAYGRKEKRETQVYFGGSPHDFTPLVSVIVPNYNHARYLRPRLESIAAQSYGNLEIIVLDDNSSDDSRKVIRDTVKDLGIEARLSFNRKNSGNVFRQWQKGIGLARGELIWICESDDFCEPDFLEHLVPAFVDESVNIAFGRIQFANREGAFQEGLDGYREGAEPGIWGHAFTRPAAQWFNGGFGVNNVIANVGGCVFRRMELPKSTWNRAREFRICGDWYLYLHIAGAGQIAYDPRAVSYFRQHDNNTSAANFHQRYYFDEHMWILAELIRLWGIAPATRARFLDKLRLQYDRLNMQERLGAFNAALEVEKVLSGGREVPHVQLHFLGFHLGGGEIFPINLANALLDRGVTVSMVAMDMSDINDAIRAQLNRRIAVFHAVHLTKRGRGNFLRAAGVSVIHSHVVNSDSFLAGLDPAPVEVPYVVTLHGSYVGLEGADPAHVQRIIDTVDQWVYIAERNLEFFETRAVDRSLFVKLPNAQPADPRPAPFTRADIGIGETDIVFALAARGIKRKGWRAAVEAMHRLRHERGRDDVHLLLAGSGAATDAAIEQADGIDGVHFLGYRAEINGIFRLSDAVLLPSRFEGESFPLSIIQALQEGKPVIATDIGEIRAMVTHEGRTAGILIENQRDSKAYFTALTDAMEAMCDDRTRAGLAALARRAGRSFDMGELVQRYLEVYDKARQVHDTRARATGTDQPRRAGLRSYASQ